MPFELMTEFGNINQAVCFVEGLVGGVALKFLVDASAQFLMARRNAKRREFDEMLDDLVWDRAQRLSKVKSALRKSAPAACAGPRPTGGPAQDRDRTETGRELLKTLTYERRSSTDAAADLKTLRKTFRPRHFRLTPAETPPRPTPIINDWPPRPPCRASSATAGATGDVPYSLGTKITSEPHASPEAVRGRNNL
ncbi:MAG: hypothetical protein ACFB00_10700 [Parvularculaceae bacterium]